MRWTQKIRLRFRSFFLRDRAEQELAEEIQIHVEEQAAVYVRGGMSAAEARRRALVEFGGVERMKEECRDARGVGWIENFIRDVHFGLRILRKSPAFALAAVLTLALGIGANTAIFSVVNAVLVRSVPYKDPGSLWMVWQNHKDRQVTRGWFSVPNFLDFREQNHVFDNLAAILEWGPTLTGEGEPERLRGAIVTRDLFSLLGVAPEAGRSFLPEEDQPNGPRAVILSDELWHRRFGASPDVLGKALRLSGQQYIVVGIMPAGMNFPDRAELWRTLRADPTTMGRGSHMLRVVGRMKRGVGVDQAYADLGVIALRLAQQYPDPNAGRGITLIPLREQLIGDVRPGLLFLQGAVLFLLLIACVNVASLLLARANSRQREMAVRTALGAGRARLVAQLLTESLLLALAGGAAGLVMARFSLALLRGILPVDMPGVEGTRLDGQVFLFTLAVSVLTGVLFGLAPALQLSKLQVNETLKESGAAVSAGRKGRRFRHLLVMSEMGLALVLLAGGGLLLKSLVQLLRVDLGYDPANVLLFQISLPDSKYGKDADVIGFYSRLLEQLRVLPGVKSAAASAFRPLDNSDFMIAVFGFAGRPVVPPGQRPNSRVMAVTPEYFATLGIPLERGRWFGNSDAAETPRVAVVNRAFVSQFLANEDPLGQRITHGLTWGNEQAAPLEIVGVVGNAKDTALASPAEPQIYVPHAQAASSSMHIAIRTSSDPMKLLPAVRARVQEMDKELPLSQISTLSTAVFESIGQPRLHLVLAGVFALVGIILAGVGIYGVAAHSVAQRLHEIGIRLALGAQRSNVMSMVLGEWLRVALAGIGGGLLGALALSGVMRSLLFEVSATDPAVFAGVALGLGALAAGVCYIPARRAMKVDPMAALRYE
jgi:putative ABC transport system permease protein